MALEEKTEAPTDRRRMEARRKGQVARSMELTSALAVLATLAVLKFTGHGAIDRLSGLFRQCFTNWPTGELTAPMAAQIGLGAVASSAAVLLPLLLTAALTAAVVTACQVGLVVSGEPLALQLSRLDPLKGLTRLVSKRGFIELTRSIVKTMIVGYVMWVTLIAELPGLVAIMDATWTQAVALVATVAWKLIVRASITVLIIAMVDYGVQRKQHENELKMTKQEVKEDMRRSEGDPTTRARIRAIMRELARRRMMADVPKADVVIVNPTHIAVAIRYDAKLNSAPVVLAKGQRLVAEKIVQIAKKNRVPVRQNIPLARALFRSVEVGQQVPLELYEAVAEVLAAVYKVRDAQRVGA